MTEKNLPLASGRGGIRARVRLPELVVGLDIHLPALLQVTEVVVDRRVEAQNCMPRGRRFRSCYRQTWSVTPNRRAGFTYCRQRLEAEVGSCW